MTGRSLANPLAGVVAAAKSKLPAETGATARAEARIKSGADTTILADVSGSMAEMVGARRAIDILREALDRVRPGMPSARLIAFDNLSREVGAGEPLPEPGGSTALHLALAAAVKCKPTRILVISDGEPDNERQALDAVATYPGTIDVIYCGDDGNRNAIDFLNRLARSGRGRVVVRDLASGPAALEQDIRRLALPRA